MKSSSLRQTPQQFVCPCGCYLFLNGEGSISSFKAIDTNVNLKVSLVASTFNMMYMYSATQPCDEHLTSARPDDGTGTAQVPRVPGGLTRRREGEDMHGAVDDNANDVPPQKAPRATATNTLTSHLTALLFCSAAIRSCSLLSSARCVLRLASCWNVPDKSKPVLLVAHGKELYG